MCKTGATFIIHLLDLAYHLSLQCWIENPTATVTKMMMMTNNPMTTVKIIPSKLLCGRLTCVGAIVGVAVTVVSIKCGEQ